MRRLISLVSATVALVGLGLVLYNATTIDRRPPAVKLVSVSAPAGDPHVAQTLTAIDIEFTEPVRTASVESRFEIDPAVPGTFTWDGPTAIFTPSQKLPADTDFTIRVRPGFEDLAGNVDELGLEGWAFRTVGAPLVLRVTPADGGTGLALDGEVELVFDRLMDTASVEDAISLDPPAAIAATWRGSVVTLAFPNGLRPATTYQLTIGTEAVDTGGLSIATPFRTGFTTAGAGLGIAGLVPDDGVAGIGIDSPIAVHFDSPIEPDSARAALHITPSVSGEVRVVALPGDAAAEPPAAPDTLLFVPSQALAPHTTYTITLDSTVTSLDDPAVVAVGRTWSFTTGAPTTSGQNQIAFLGDRGGVRNVWVMNPDGTNQRELTVELVPVTSFDVTGDGREVVYAAGGAVTLMTIDGSSRQQVTAVDGRFEYAPTFSPDDLGIIVARRDANGGDAGYWLVPRPGTAGDERQLLDHGAPPPGSSALVGDGIPETDGMPVWASRVAFDPDGRTALLVTAGGEVFLVDLSDPDGAIPPLPVALRAEAAPAWDVARGGFILAATESAAGPARLFTIDLDGSVRGLDGTDGAAGPVAPGADGTLAVQVRPSTGVSVLRQIALDGTVRELAGAAGVDDRWPALSPDGSTLLIGRTISARPTASDGIWLLDRASGVVRQLTRDGAFARWIP
jgi:Bacterial Ig-like domain/WD40-like Beta Propeller Repeat